MMAKYKRKQASSSGSGSEELTSEENDDSTWIQWFCSLKGNEFFCEIDEEYIQDDFNLTGLRSLVPNYDYALDLILDSETEGLTEEQQDIVQTAAEFLYGLIHARFVLTSRGMIAMVFYYFLLSIFIKYKAIKQANSTLARKISKN